MCCKARATASAWVINFHAKLTRSLRSIDAGAALRTALSLRLLMWCVALVVTGLFAWAGVLAATLLLALLWQGMDR